MEGIRFIKLDELKLFRVNLSISSVRSSSGMAARVSFMLLLLNLFVFFLDLGNLLMRIDEFIIISEFHLELGQMAILIFRRNKFSKGNPFSLERRDKDLYFADKLQQLQLTSSGFRGS